MFYDTIYKKQLFEETGGTDPSNEAGANEPNNEQNNEPEKKYTDADLDKIINKKFAEWQKKQQKAVDEAAKLAGMNAQEKAEHERDELQKELDAYKRKDTLSEMAKTVRTYAETEQITIPEEVVAILTTDDANATDANVKAYTKAFKAAVQAEVKAQLTRAKVPTASSGTGALTKEDIAKIADPIARQKAIRENMDLYRKH